MNVNNVTKEKDHKQIFQCFETIFIHLHDRKLSVLYDKKKNFYVHVQISSLNNDDDDDVQDVLKSTEYISHFFTFQISFENFSSFFYFTKKKFRKKLLQKK